MTENAENRPRRALRSVLDEEGGTLATPEAKRAVEAAVAPLGVLRTQKVPTAGEMKVQFNVRSSVSTRERLNRYAYIERLTLGQAIDQLLDLGEARTNYRDNP